MTDISKCCGRGCPFKYGCWRHEASPSLTQCWIDPEECIGSDFSLIWPMTQKTKEGCEKAFNKEL